MRTLWRKKKTRAHQSRLAKAYRSNRKPTAGGHQTHQRNFEINGVISESYQAPTQSIELMNRVYRLTSPAAAVFVSVKNPSFVSV